MLEHPSIFFRCLTTTTCLVILAGDLGRVPTPPMAGAVNPTLDRLNPRPVVCLLLNSGPTVSRCEWIPKFVNGVLGR